MILRIRVDLPLKNKICDIFRGKTLTKCLSRSTCMMNGQVVTTWSEKLTTDFLYIIMLFAEHYSVCVFVCLFVCGTKQWI